MQLFAVGTDRRLHRWRYENGSWTGSDTITPLILNAGLFGPRCVSQQADGKIDLALAQEGTNSVYHLRIGPNGTYAGTPQDSVRSADLNGFLIRVGGNVTDVPTLIALNPMKVGILVPGTDGIVYSNWLTSRIIHPSDPRPFRTGSEGRGQKTDFEYYWEGYRPISQPNIRVGGIARLTTNEITALAADERGRIFVNSFGGWMWTGFHPLLGQRADTQNQALNFRPAVLTSH